MSRISPRVAEARKALLALSGEEVQQALAVLPLTAAPTSGGAHDAGSRWYGPLTEAMRAQLGTASVGYSVFRKRSAGRVYAVSAEEAESYLHGWLRGRSSRLEREAFRRMSAELVIAAARRQSVDFPLWTRVASCLRDLPALVEKAFPGYIAAGLLIRVIGSRTKRP